MCVEFPDLRRDAPQNLFDMLRGRELFLHRIQNDLLDQAAPNEQLVIAGSFGCTDTSIVAATLTAHLRHRRATLAADHRSREQVCGKVFLPAFLEQQ